MSTYSKLATLVIAVFIAAMVYDVETKPSKACAILGTIQCEVAK